MALKKSKEATEAEVVKPAKKSIKTSAKASKSATKVAKKDAPKLVQKISDLRELTVAELQKALTETRENLQTTQKMLKANELPASHVIRATKKQIARIHTVLTEKIREEKSNV